jgi:molecular chaperone GrpE
MQSSPGTEQQSEPPAEDVRAQLEEARAQLAASEDRYLRARADLENYRRRSEQDLARRVREQSDDLLRMWLEVVDSVERALALTGDDGDAAGGLQAFRDQIEAILSRQGVRRIGEVGERFDPDVHEAIAVVPDGDREAGTVADVARSGYVVDDRVLRPAQVAVVRRNDTA